LSAGQTSSRRRGGFAAGKTPHKTYYFTQDGLGSVRTLSDNSGTIKNKYDYSAFGEKYAPNTVEAVENRYTYTGRDRNPVSSTMYYRWRVYSAGVGRFVSRDPIGYEGGINVYSYVGSSPMLYRDPFGEIQRSTADQHGSFGRAKIHHARQTTKKKTSYIVKFWILKPEFKLECECDDDGKWSLEENPYTWVDQYLHPLPLAKPNWIFNLQWKFKFVGPNSQHNSIYDEYRIQGNETNDAILAEALQAGRDQFLKRWKGIYNLAHGIIADEAKNKYSTLAECEEKAKEAKELAEYVIDGVKDSLKVWTY